MAENAVDIVNRALREFKRYTGDGLPGEPVNAPLPVGDPQSGSHNPKKSDLRSAVLPAVTAAIDARREADRALSEAERAESEADRADAEADRAQVSANDALSSKTQAELAALAAGAPLFTSEPDLSSAPTPYLLQVEAGTQIWEHDGDTATMAGWLGKVEFPTVAALLAFSGPLGPVGTELEAQGFRYEVAASDAVDWHVETAGGVGLNVLPFGLDAYPEQFGAVGNATWGASTGADDYPALQNWINTCCANGWVARLMAKAYGTTQTLLVPSRLEMIGENVVNSGFQKLADVVLLQVQPGGPETQNGFYDKIRLNGRGNSSSLGSAANENSPAMIIHSKCHLGSVLAVSIGGPGWSGPADPESGCFAFGFFSSDSGNVNLSKADRLYAQSVYGDGVYIANLPGGSVDINGMNVTVHRAFRMTGFAINSRGGWRNTFMVEQAEGGQAPDLPGAINQSGVFKLNCMESDAYCTYFAGDFNFGVVFQNQWNRVTFCRNRGQTPAVFEDPRNTLIDIFGGVNYQGVGMQSTGNALASPGSFRGVQRVGSNRTPNGNTAAHGDAAEFLVLAPFYDGSALPVGRGRNLYGDLIFAMNANTMSTSQRTSLGRVTIDVRNQDNFTHATMFGEVGRDTINLDLVTLKVGGMSFLALRTNEPDLFRHVFFDGFSSEVQQVIKLRTADVTDVAVYTPITPFKFFGRPGDQIGNNIAMHSGNVATSISAAPLFRGQLATSGGQGYMAVGTSGPGDWRQITNA